MLIGERSVLLTVMTLQAVLGEALVEIASG